MVKHSVRALLTGLIDYAGLFPPAKLDLDIALRNYRQYRTGEHAWMLGRFVLPASTPAPDIPLAIVAPPNVRPNPAWDVIEWKPGREPASIPGVTQYYEATPLHAIAAAGSRAKIRTGGDSIPSPAAFMLFLEDCATLRLPFKATAGLHHPLPCGAMHGFMNVFLAAAFLWSGTALPQLLEELDPASFEFTDAAASWRGHTLPTEAIIDARRNFAIGFGSCSFEEPIVELQGLRWL